MTKNGHNSHYKKINNQGDYTFLLIITKQYVNSIRDIEGKTLRK